MTATRTDGSTAAASASGRRGRAAAASRSTSSLQRDRAGAAAEQRLTPFVQLQGGAWPALPAEHPLARSSSPRGRPATAARASPAGTARAGCQQVRVGGPLAPRRRRRRKPAASSPVTSSSGPVISSSVTDGARRVVAAQGDHPHPDALHAFGGQVVQPVLGQPDGGAAVRSGGLAVLARRRSARARHTRPGRPSRAAPPRRHSRCRLHPVADPLPPVGVLPDDPVGQQLRGAARPQVRRTPSINAWQIPSPASPESR